ncbi:MAG TPA: PD-(D/E)XK nuclease family protein [Nitrospira sp.]|nr:PD-(D/E)XK nuclease family protein [Nitrospira sp.]
MVKVVTGRFHPSLESALVEDIQRIKTSDAWAPVAVVVPSKPVLDRIRRVLAVERRLSFLNLHLLTFHQFALRLTDERRGSHHIGLRLVDDLFFEYLIGHLVERRSHELPALRRLAHSPGTRGALWSTIRDLKDGGVDPATALQALEEGCFGDEDREWLRGLFSLQAAVQETSARLNVGTADDLAEALRDALSASRFLSSLRHVCYYGFYDVTQVQLSLFQEVVDRVPATLFFPLANDPSFAFARRFFDRHIQPLLGAQSRVDVIADQPSSLPEISVQSVIGAEEELSVTCRAILDLVETHSYRFDEIGVVARTLEPYSTALHSVFARHCVPLTTTAGRPLIHHPLSKTLLLLATLPVKNFYRNAVLDVVTSPFYAGHRRAAAGGATGYRPQQWRAVIDALNITQGMDEWKRLEQCCASALELDGSGDEAGAIGPFIVLPEVIAGLRNAVSPLLDSYAGLPEQGSFDALLKAFRRLVDEHLSRPTDGEDGRPDASDGGIDNLWEAIDHTIVRVGDLALIDRVLTWAEFAEVLIHAFERASVPLETSAPQGVIVTDAMAARGLPFKALFVLGLNEKVFPRFIREDPFLRDRHRRVLETTLGYKVDEKLPGYDEEALLFTLLTQAAVQRLYLSFQRADEAGRILASSPYLTDVRQRSGMLAPPIDVVPRRMSERLAQRPTMSRFLPPSDVAQWMAVMGTNPTEFLQATGREALLFRKGAEALGRTEDEDPALTDFDGLTGALDSHWTKIAARGLAPTPLERYARCPFRYFAADVLRLTPVRTTTSDEPDGRVLGTFCHAALRRCYEMLLPTGWPEQPVTDDTVDFCIETAIGEASLEIEREHRTGHFLLWERAKTRISDVITAAVDDDTRRYREAPFTPVAFEVAAEGALADIPAKGATSLKIRGRIDRLDRHRESGMLRIIDYKLKLGRSIAIEDRHLVQSAVRGYRLQPPLYTRLHVPGQGTPAEAQLLFLAPSWSTPVWRSSFDANVWTQEAGTMLRHTLSRLINGIRDGQFFIVPDSYCGTCEFRVACRREHQPTLWRASRSDEAKQLTALRTLEVKP